ncbi:MAG TPA: tail fiber domain-containing protein [Candidatus Udaeobacter sp.]
MNRMVPSPTLTRSLLILVVLFSIRIVPKASAVSPPPDGGYAGFNTAEGTNALQNLTTGIGNASVGWYSLFSNTVGNFNTALGAGTLFSNVGELSGYGTENTAVGAAALLNNTRGTRNTAVGAFALFYNVGAANIGPDGSNNTAVGDRALFNNTTGCCNIAMGYQPLQANTEGFNDVAIGNQALLNNTTGDENTAIGTSTMTSNLTGRFNTALGYSSGSNITGDGNVCIGVGVDGEEGVDNSTYIRNINTTTQSFSAGVNDYVTVRLSDGRLGHTTVVSSQRYKENIKPLAADSEALYALRPVSFRLKKEYDETQAVGFGLIAEEVEDVDPALVYCNNKGQVESVRYEMVNAMLLNEFLKEHRKVQEQEATIARLTKEMENVLARLKEHDSKIQKVSDQIELSDSAGRVVSD